MKTLLISLVLFVFSPPVLAQLVGDNGWFNTLSGFFGWLDTAKTFSHVVRENGSSNYFQEYSSGGGTFYNFPNNIIGLTWHKYFQLARPDSISVNLKSHSWINTNRVFVVLTLQDENGQGAYLGNQSKTLPRDSGWTKYYFDLTALDFMNTIKIVSIQFSLTAVESCYVAGVVDVDSMMAIDNGKSSIIDLFGDSLTGIIVLEQIPKEFVLEQNYPNPFNPSTTIRFTVPQRKQVNLTVFNSLGQEIQTLVSEERGIGTYEVSFDASGIPSGVYFYKLQAGSFVETKKMLFLK